MPGKIAVLSCGVALFLPGLVPAEQPRPREHFQNAEVLYDWVSNSRGDKLRTFLTRPNNAGGKVPVLFFVGWLSCDSIENPQGETDGFGALIIRLIEQSGYGTVRTEKPGVGESQGTPCEKADFESELEGYQAAFDSMGKYEFLDRDRVIMIGLSNGGGFAPLVSRGHKVRGFVAAGSWGRTWYEHMLENERVRLTSEGKSAAEVNDTIKAFSQFYDLYLMQGQTPGQVLAEHPLWKNLWYDAPDGQYGRPAQFYQQLQALNLGDVWQKVDAPVLVIRGSKDTIMSRADSSAIAETVNRVHAGKARYLELDGMTHGFTVDKKFHSEVVSEILKWAQEQLAAGE
ncbi:MAG TPA: alpha/beta hydrolase [Candidatus Dormibacteraeota bacterium]|nr:alpha/beta hydrolase [Candidatus Dormibacteraeota bacterium]